MRVPCSMTPMGLQRQALFRRLHVAFASRYGLGSHHVPISRLHHTAHALAVYASQQPLPNCHARLATGRSPTFAGWDSHPLTHFMKFPL